MQEHEMPTWGDIFRSALADLDAARSALADASGWLCSDWRPLGSSLPDGAGTVRHDVVEQIGRLKGEIDEAKGALWSVLEEQAPRSARS